jgi:hypothetical protein
MLLVNQTGDNDSGLDLSTNDQIGFKIANASKWTLNSSGNLFPAATSQGIVLGATSDTASNRLEDYEEGEFVATLDNSVTLHSSADSLSYTKIGRQVMICGQIRISSSNTNSVVINNLPFTSISATDNAEFTFGTVRLYEYNIPSDSKYVGCYTVASDTRLHFTNVRDNAVTDPLDADQDGYLMFTTTYFAA